MTSAARLAAVTVACEVRENGAYANLSLPKIISSARLNQRDAAEATALSYGSSRWLGFIDAVLHECVSRPLSALDGGVLDILRVAAYELTLGGELAHIVNEWVEVAKTNERRAAGLVNATLRKVTARSVLEWRELFAESLTGDEQIEAMTSHPAWIVRAFQSLVPADEVQALIDADNEPALPTLVALPGLASVPADAIRGALSPYAYAAPPGPISAIDGISEGYIRVQDEGSQIAALLLGAVSPITRGEQWLDLCAGPGGKSALLASLVIPEGGTLIANEPSPHRAELVRQSVRAFPERVSVTLEDGRNFGHDFPNRFDRVLVDAPCTGLGALRRRPESRWRKHEEDLDELTALQFELLSAAVLATRIGGYIGYVTCSPHPRETVGVVSRVLAEHSGLLALDTGAVLTTITPKTVGAISGTAVQLWPHRHGTDAMYIQLLQRTR
jgi:16S rRNA (cytosine967-C5)-methyltransferase